MFIYDIRAIRPFVLFVIDMVCHGILPHFSGPISIPGL
jgi:hypothetical protein